MIWNDLREQFLRTGLTVSTAESLTAGMVAATIANASGSSKYLVGGTVAYNIDQKVTLLNVDRTHAASCNCVSDRVAFEMADGALVNHGSHIAVATTGYAEPWPDGGISEPYAEYAIITPHKKIAVGRIYGGNMGRQEVREFVTLQVLHKLLEYLRTAEPAPTLSHR